MLTKIPMDTFGKIRSNTRSSIRGKLRGLSGGFTLIELVIVMVIVAIGVALAVPSFEDIAQKRQTTSEAEQLAAFLGVAQSEAVKWNEEVRISLDYSSATDWCIGAATGSADCDCELSEDSDITDEPRTDSFCDIGGAPNIAGARHTMDNLAFNKSTMVSYFAGTDDKFSFDPVRGTMTAVDLVLGPRTFVIESTNTNYQLQVEVSVVGRIRICNSDSTKKVPGYPDC